MDRLHAQRWAISMFRCCQASFFLCTSTWRVCQEYPPSGDAISGMMPTVQHRTHGGAGLVWRAQAEMDVDGGEGGPGAPLRADSVAVLLGQALQAQDRALLEKCATPSSSHACARAS